MSHLARRWRDPEPAPLAGAAASLHRQGCPVLDLVTANPHEHGISFPASELRAIMLEAAERIAVYQPDAMGHGRAREAVAAWYARRGAPADPARILLTPGTSQAYFYALRLLADAGDEILVPSPGYPLFDDLAAIAGVRLRRYHLRRERGQWSIDPDEVDFQCTPRTRSARRAHAR